MREEFRNPFAWVIGSIEVASETGPARKSIRGRVGRQRNAIVIGRIPDRAPTRTDLALARTPRAAEFENDAGYDTRERQRAGHDAQQHRDRAG